MEISATSNGVGGSHTFSSDVLTIEIHGPDQEHLSVIDVPGIFRTETDGITTEADISRVNNMVKSQMSNVRSIMLAVIPASVNPATQEILQLAGAVDPDGLRTIGVLTKPDLVDKGAIDDVVDMLQGRRHPLKLGWTVVRNPGQKELNLAKNRFDLEKEFFTGQAPWNTIDVSQIGIVVCGRACARYWVTISGVSFQR